MKIQDELRVISELLRRLIIYRSLNEARLIQELRQLSEQANSQLSFYGWYGKLLEKHPNAPNCWTTYLEELVRANENFFTYSAERGETGQIPAAILKAVDSDVEIILKLLRWVPEQLLTENSTEFSDIPSFAIPHDDIQSYRQSLAKTARTKGVGVFGQYNAVVWVHASRNFDPVQNPDPITFDRLIGYNHQKQILQQNTHQFIKGLPANHVLLYGDRGSGKSSSVKALLHQFAPLGLRIVEVSKEDLTDFPDIVKRLRPRGLRFLLYVDDLSFETEEIQYKHLKAVLEGTLESKAENILIYATSNRRHLLKETFADRENDLHGNDTVQEQLSLSDRFGITLTYSSPDQNEFLAIVNGLAKQRGLKVNQVDLEKQALQWERLHNGRTGRTAKQFIDQLEGELKGMLL